LTNPAAQHKDELDDIAPALEHVAVQTARRAVEAQARAAKLGLSVAVVPKANAPKKAIEGLTIHPVERVEQAIDILRGL